MPIPKISSKELKTISPKNLLKYLTDFRNYYIFASKQAEEAGDKPRNIEDCFEAFFDEICEITDPECQAYREDFEEFLTEFYETVMTSSIFSESDRAAFNKVSSERSAEDEISSQANSEDEFYQTPVSGEEAFSLPKFHALAKNNAINPKPQRAKPNISDRNSTSSEEGFAPSLSTISEGSRERSTSEEGSPSPTSIISEMRSPTRSGSAFSLLNKSNKPSNRSSPTQ